MLSRFRPVLLTSAILTSAALVPLLPAQNSEVVGPPEPDFSAAAEESVPSEPNLDGVDSSILLDDPVPTESAAPTEPVVPTESAAPTEPVVPTESAAQTEPIVPTESAAQTEPAVPAESATQTEPAVPAESTVLTEPAVPAESTVLTEPTVPAESTAPTEEPTVPAESAAPTEPAVSAELTTNAGSSNSFHSPNSVVSNLTESEKDAQREAQRKSRLRTLPGAVSGADDATTPARKMAQAETGAHVKKASSAPVSQSQKLMERLCATRFTVLDGVEAIDLQTFLNAPSLGTGGETLSQALSVYWQASVIQSEVNYWQDRLTAINKLAASATQTERPLYEAAAASAQANLNAAKISLRVNAVEMGRTAGYAREVTAKTLPHAGEYETRYEQIRDSLQGSYGTIPQNVTYFHGLVTLRQNQLIAAAAAYQTAENLLKLETRQAGNATAILLAWDTLNERRRIFGEILIEFNQDILNYVLLVSQRRGPALVPLLVRTTSEVALDAPPSSRTPNLPTPPDPSEIPSAAQPSIMAPAESASPTFESGNGAAVSPSIPASTPAPTVPAPTVPAPTVPAPTVPAPGIPSVDAGIPTSEVEEIYGENAAIDLQLPSAPGSELGAPAIETPPPGNDFEPIGGETGVDSNPILSTPGGTNGASLSQPSQTNSMPWSASYPQTNSDVPSDGQPATPSVFSFSLSDVLSRVQPSARQSAVITYWRYVMLQKQLCVLDYQQKILSAAARRVLSGGFQEQTAKMGMQVELQSLVLKTEQVGTQAEIWRELCRLERNWGKQPDWREENPFPVAETDLKAESFQVGLDRYAPGSHQELQTLPQARHLYFCAKELPSAFQSVLSLSDLVASPNGGGAEKTILDGIQTHSSEELTILLARLGFARKASLRYLQLLCSINTSYSSCILADNSGNLPSEELAALLSE